MPSSAKYILGRLAFSLVTLLVIAIATFSLMHSIPGGPFSRERALPKEIEAHLARKYNLDESTARQFQRYMTGLVKGDLGLSLYHEGRTTNTIIAETFPKSAAIGFTGFVIAFALGVPVGIFAAMRRDRLTDHALMLAAILGVSVPGFIVASLLQYWLAFKFGWAPAAGWGESWWQVLLPALALAAFPLAFVSRLVRTSMLNVLNADYLRTARSKGLHLSLIHI